MNPRYSSPAKTWNIRSLFQAGEWVSHHQWPEDTFVHLLDAVGACLCGPEIVQVEVGPNHFVPHVTHQPFDGRYYELDEDDLHGLV